MRRIIKCLCIVSVLTSIVSCDLIGGEKTTESKAPGSIAQLSDSVKSLKATQDSINSALTEKVVTLTDELNKANKEIAELKNDVRQQTKPNNLWNVISIVAGLLSIGAILLQVFKRTGNAEIDNRIHDIERTLRSLNNENARRLAEKYNTQNRVQASTTKPSAYSQHELSDIKSRLDSLETSIKNQTKKGQQVSTNDATIENKEQKQTVLTKVCTEYYKAVSNKFFTEVLPSQQEGCIYILTYTNETDGSFEIVSLPKMKQSNGWEDVVETTGNCPISEANHHKVLTKGKCRKREGLWEVTDKLRIEISK